MATTIRVADAGFEKPRLVGEVFIAQAYNAHATGWQVLPEVPPC
jgi:hypothetical protein